jgi:hypothetical protein
MMTPTTVGFVVETVFLREGVNKSASVLMSLNVLNYAHEQLTPMLKSSPCTSHQVGGHHHRITSVLSMVAVSGYPDVTSGYVTAPNGLLNITPCHAMEHHIATPQCLFALLSLLLVSLVAAFIPQSSEDGLVGIRSRLWMLQSVTNFFYIPMSRGQSSCNSSSSTVPPKSGQSRTRGRQMVQKRQHSASDGSKNGRKDSSGRRGKEKKLDDILFKDMKEPFGCPYHWRRPDMWAVCRFFRRPPGKEFHRLKDHLDEYHKLDHFCDRCNQGFKLESEFVAHNQTGFCQVDGARDYLRGFDKIQAAQLCDTRSANSRFKRSSTYKEKWKVIYHILFPDVEESGIPDPYLDPNVRDVFRYFQSSDFNILTTPDDFNNWRIDQPSNNLSLEQPGHAQGHDPPADLDDNLAGISIGTEAIDHTFRFSPEGVGGFTPSLPVASYENFSGVDDSNDRMSHPQYLNPATVLHLNNMSNDFLSPRQRWQPSSEYSSGELLLSQDNRTWASSTTQVSAPYMQPQRGTNQTGLSQFSVPSVPGAEDQLEIGGQFPKGVIPRTSDTDQSNISKSPG